MSRSRQVQLAEDLGFLLSRAGGLVAGQVNRALAPVDLKVRPYSVLILACEQAEGVNQRSVAATLGLDPSQIVALIDDLERRGLVERVADAADRRNKLIVATDAGRELLEQAHRRADEVHERLFGGLPAGVVNSLKEALRAVVLNE
ncbi:MarR family winged helix-turn-helix transcriptional regulator [Nocardia grenadensis]|uniref:MarR family winged helix-turn-helix transcriptional regulator n=1 Tax=Nocardia grenadensis TaxID=931537 RepID=UPI0007A382F4|nr:MarR family transcriptional regulator [Nocardia grenadensis]